MTLGWLFGHAVVRCGHLVGGDLLMFVGAVNQWVFGTGRGIPDHQRTGRLCVLFEGPDAAQTRARLYWSWV